MDRAIVAIGSLVLASGLSAAADEARHPFMLWTAQEAAALRKKIEIEPWAKAAYARGADNLLRFGVMGDKAAGEEEKKLLLADLGASEPAGAGDAYKTASARNAFRYDVVQDLLTPGERAKVKAAFVQAIQWRAADVAKARWTRSNWLPNLAYVGYMRLHLAAAATGDRDFIRTLWSAPNGLKWYLDEYLSDGGFYNEEFGKSMWMYEPMAQWCWAMDRLGMGDIGWDYKGRQGASFRGSIESLIRLTYPRVDLDRPFFHFARLSIGDARGGGAGLSGGPVAIFQHRLVAGDVPREMLSQKGFGGYIGYANALEHLHAKWPDAGYGYFLVQHRGDGNAYDMPLRFGVAPIAPSAKPPPAPSGVYPGRGLVMLRAEESPAYWESPAPAVSMRLATPYAHHVQDCLALTGFYAFNRPLYVNHSHPTGYTGTDPGYSNSIRSHSAVIVDGMEPACLTVPLATRQGLGPLVKFAAARGKGVYPGVDQTRALMLTREYLLDVSCLVSPRPRDYLWQVHTFGQACPDNPAAWAESADLRASLGDLGRERSCATGDTWTVTAVQTSGTQNEKFCPFGPRWFTDRVGVRVTMLGEPGTRAYTAWAPVVPSIPGDWRGRNRFAYGEDEPAGVAVVATRRAAATIFAAVHEPFQTTRRLRAVRRVAQDAGGIVVAVHGEAFTDYLMLRFGDDVGKPVTMGSGDETFTFADYGYVRMANGRAETAGDVKVARLPSPAAAPAAAGPIAARFQPPSALCLPTGGKGARTLKLRNSGSRPISAEIPVTASKGLAVSPAAISLRDLPAGAELDIAIAVDAAKSAANVLHRVGVGGSLADGLEVQHAALTVANGVATDGRTQVGDEFRQTVYSPRYVATYWFMESAGATELLDPAGYRRHDAGGHSYPSLGVRTADAQGRARWEVSKAGKYPYFIPILIAPDPAQPRQFYEHGQHVHGFSGGLAHWFTEDWIVVRSRKAKDDEMIALEWSPRGGYRSGLADCIPGRDGALAAAKMPGAAFVIDDQGGKHSLLPKPPPALAAGGVGAVFLRPDGYEHGSAMFYPKGAKWLDGRVAQPGNTPMAFTFCTDAEFPALLKKWRDAPHTGEAAPADVERNRGAFGPTVAQPE